MTAKDALRVLAGRGLRSVVPGHTRPAAAGRRLRDPDRVRVLLGALVVSGEPPS